MSEKRTCSIEGCENGGKIARGWCGTHYKHWRLYGDPLMVPPVPTPEERFWSKVDKAGPDGFHSQTGENLGACWLWTGALNSQNGQGYGVAWAVGRLVVAHRCSYEMLTGPIPEGLQIDHLCRVRTCVNPDHLEPVTKRENGRRGLGGVLKTHCPAGHEYSPENTFVDHQGHRFCRACKRDRERRYYRQGQKTGARA